MHWLNQYRNVSIKPLDFGTRNTVYKALDRQKVLDGDPNPFVTVKILESRWSSRELPLDKLEDAAAWYKLLSHPNILRFLGSCGMTLRCT